MGGPAEALAAPWSFACPDWVERLEQGRSLVPDLPLDRVEADRAVGIFNKLRLPDVPGQPTMGEAAGEWFRDIVRAAFGSLDPATGRRRVAEIMAMVPKKNSKTTGAAGVMITAMLMNKRPRAEMLFIGPTQDIADLAFQQASGMIEADPYLQKRFRVAEHLKTIEDRTNKAKLKIKTFDMKVMTGVKPVVVMVDELHIISTYSYATRVFGQIRGGLIANKESLLIVTTTQSDEPPAGLFKQELKYARGVRDGRITEKVRMLPILYEFPEAIQTSQVKPYPWMDPKIWPMVLPNLGYSIEVDRLYEEFIGARDKGEEELRRWASQHLNVEIGMAMHSDRWAGVDHWLGAADDTITLDELEDRCDVVVFGIDGGGLDDLLGLSALGRCRVTRDWLLWNRAWAHPEVFERRQDIAERLRDFINDGDLVLCATPSQALKEVADIIERFHEAGLLPEKYAVGLDPQGVAAMVEEIVGRGLDRDQLVAVPQGYRLSSAVWGVEFKLKDGTFWHAGQPLMAWCAGNAVAEQSGNAVLITKQAAGKAKIDPLISAFNAVKLMERNPEASLKRTDADTVVVL